MIRRWQFILFASLALGASSSLRAQAPPPAAPSVGSATTGPVSGAPGSAQNNYSGSVPSKLVSGVLPVSLSEAIDRGLKQNLGLLLASEDVKYARGLRWKELSALLPNVSATPYVNVSQIDLAEYGFHFAGVPSVIGPFSYFDARANFSQSLFDWHSVERWRAANESLKSAQYTAKDARDLVVLAVGYTYLQAIADEARIDTADAQVKSAQALYDQAADQVKAGTSPAIDALRAQVELKTRQQQLIQARNDFAIQKLTVARVIGLAPGQEFELTDKSPYAPFAALSVNEALQRAYSTRQDFQAALADVRAAEYSRKAAFAEHYPTLTFGGDYGFAGQHPSTNSHGVFDARGTLTIPIFAGNRTHADVLEADAQLQQSRDRLENVRAQIDTDVRTALLNLESSSEQVTVAQDNVKLADQALTQSRDRFVAGVTDTVEVVQAEEAVASANESYISSLYSYNYAKISLARAMGVADQTVREYFKEGR
ncbi:MAG: TolC family protein [Candidatus Acidiferrales bacterium]